MHLNRLPSKPQIFPVTELNCLALKNFEFVSMFEKGGKISDMFISKPTSDIKIAPTGDTP